MDSRLLAALEAIDSIAGPLAPEVIGRPRDGRWSIGEILEHLTLAFTANAEAIEKTVASGQRRVRRPSWKQTLGRIMVLDVGYFPKVQAPEMTVPTGGVDPAVSLVAIRAGLARVDEALSRAAASFGENVAVVNHPYLAGLSVTHWRKLHWRHTIHHMRQVRAIASDVLSRPAR